VYYVLDKDLDINIVGGVKEDDPGFGLKYSRGQEIELSELPQNLIVKIEFGPKTLPDYFELGGTPIVSNKFSDILRSVGVDNVQLFSTKVQMPDQVLAGYSVLNVIGRISCINLNKTNCTKHRNRIVRINNLVLDEDNIHGFKMVRPHEFELMILVSEDVKNAINGLPGVTIRAADGWNDSHKY
jgi:hypothetical protein